MARPKLSGKKRKKHRVIVRLADREKKELDRLAVIYGNRSKALRNLLKRGI